MFDRAFILSSLLHGSGQSSETTLCGNILVNPRFLYVMPPESPANAAGSATGYRFRESTVFDLLRSFAAGKEVPGSGSANALAAALATCLTTSVAIKTHQAQGTRYVQVQQSARDIERRANRLFERLLDLIDADSAAFAPVIAIRRRTGRVDEAIKQDEALRAEVAALKPATEIPLEIARLAIDAGELALSMLDSGFVPARGESYTALGQAVAAVDGAIFVAQLNIKTIRRRVAKLNDPELEAAWLTRMVRDIRDLRAGWRELRVREQLARKVADSEMRG
jgi:formiminotetrahydrofolate cyclodeaminase